MAAAKANVITASRHPRFRPVGVDNYLLAGSTQRYHLWGDHVGRRLVIDHAGRIGVGLDEGDVVVVLESGAGFPTTCIIGWPSEIAVQL
jgi:hypothetical protein